MKSRSAWVEGNRKLEEKLCAIVEPGNTHICMEYTLKDCVSMCMPVCVCTHADVCASMHVCMCVYRDKREMDGVGEDAWWEP